jgi:hypothetical protein
MRSCAAGELGTWATKGHNFGMLPATLLDPGYRPERIVGRKETYPVALHSGQGHHLDGTKTHLVKEGKGCRRQRNYLVPVDFDIPPTPNCAFASRFDSWNARTLGCLRPLVLVMTASGM